MRSGSIGQPVRREREQGPNMLKIWLKIWLTPLAIGLFCIHTAAAAAPEGGAPSANDRAPTAAQLNALLAAHDWTGLATALARAKPGEGIAQRMEWLREKLLAGGGALLGFLYSQDLWNAGREAKSPDPMNDMRVTAGLFTLYTLELIMIDGEKCEDRSAPSHRVDQLIENNRPILAFLKKQPAEVKEKVVDLAIALERRTEPLRTDDDFLCRDGLDQMQAGLAAGLSREVPNSRKDGPGKTIEVDAPPDYKPKLLPADVYKPGQQKVREAMRATLRAIIK